MCRRTTPSSPASRCSSSPSRPPPAPTGRSARPAQVRAGYGTNKTFTITPDTGYLVADVLVDGTSAGAVTSYTFNNIQANHTIVASFKLSGSHHHGERRHGRHDPSLASAVIATYRHGQDLHDHAGYRLPWWPTCWSTASQRAQSPPTSSPMYRANHTIAASFTLQQFTHYGDGRHGRHDQSFRCSGGCTTMTDKTFTVTPNTGLPDQRRCGGWRPRWER